MAYEMQIRDSQDQVKVRSPWAAALLPIVTLGIYHLVWWYRINREMRDYGQAKGYDLGQNPTNSVLALFPGGLIIVPALITYWRGTKRVRAPRSSPARSRSTAGSRSCSTSSSRPASGPTSRSRSTRSGRPRPNRSRASPRRRRASRPDAAADCPKNRRRPRRRPPREDPATGGAAGRAARVGLSERAEPGVARWPTPVSTAT